MPGTMSVGGLASGLKTDDIIAKIMEYARQPQDKLKADKAEAQSRLAAWQDLNTRVLALKIKADSVAGATSFRKMQATSSNTEILSASASTDAVAGTYYVKVTQRAQAHQVSSQAGAYASMNDVVGTGTVTIGLNSGASFSVTLGTSNNTLVGLRDAINKANKGVHADVVNAGTSASPDYRLLLTSSATGEAAGMSSVTSTLAGGTTPTFNLATPVQHAQNAVLTIGGGDGTQPITIEKDTNTFSDVVPGVTLSVLDADEGKTAKIEVSSDIASIKTSINDLVTQYNSLMDAVDAQTDFDSETGESGLLLGDYQLQAVQMDIQSAITEAVRGLTPKFSALSTIGISLDTGGHLAVDDAALTEALQTNLDDAMKIFVPDLQTDTSYVSYLASTTDTKASPLGGWTVDVTQAARRAQVTAGQAMTSDLDAAESLWINGVEIGLDADMTLTQVVSRINAYSNQTNVSALATGADGTGSGSYLTFRRVQYGSAYDVTVVSSRSQTAGNNSGIGNVTAKASDPEGESASGPGQGLAGLDVAGTINGQSATGTGQILSLANAGGSNDAKGLSLLVTCESPLAGINAKFTKGVGVSLRDLLVDMTSVTGALSTAQDGINSQISDLDDSIARLEESLADQEARWYEKFSAMEAQLSQLQAQGNYLTQQLSSLSAKK